jgi:UDP-hydrolysing UDP-N-acetyl-D-glucosamine 2-epimerase
MAERTRAGARRRVLVVTGTRAEFGLLTPVMRAIDGHRSLRLLVGVTGAHMLGPAFTHKDVARAFAIDARWPMQRTGHATRMDDARALARGIEGCARALAALRPDWVLVLGDRIEALAASAAASVSGIAVCHLHGGDRAEGIADEAMRHAISKLAHLHACATRQSAQRLVRMGERPELVHAVGSPAIDGLADIAPMSDEEAAALGDPRTVILHHPSGLPEARERAMIRAIVRGLEIFSPGNVLCLAPNHDAGRETIARELQARCARTRGKVRFAWRDHLPRPQFLTLLKRLAPTADAIGGLLIGNSSAGLIEAQALGVRVVNVGPRQDGRERTRRVTDVPEHELAHLASKVDRALSLDMRGGQATHPYGDGQAGTRTAALLAKINPHDPALLRKRNTY